MDGQDVLQHDVPNADCVISASLMKLPMRIVSEPESAYEDANGKSNDRDRVWYLLAALRSEGLATR